MSFKIVRNDITKMNTEAIVNTANAKPVVGSGCDRAIYKAAGYEELLRYRRENIGVVKEGEVFATPGFGLEAKMIIHAVSPLYRGGWFGEEKKLRSCYRKSLQFAKERGIRSIAFPLIATGGFGYPKEEGMRIAVDEIHAFLLNNEMEIYLVVFGNRETKLGEKLYPDLEAYIDQNYVDSVRGERYEDFDDFFRRFDPIEYDASYGMRMPDKVEYDASYGMRMPDEAEYNASYGMPDEIKYNKRQVSTRRIGSRSEADFSIGKKPIEAKAFNMRFEEVHESKLNERIKHLSDTFSEYLMYLIKEKNLKNAEVYKRAIVDKKIFSKIKNNKSYHPNKLTALCLCVGARLNLDESKDLLARAGYALSPCDKTDIIFSYFIENEIYDMIELDIQLEEHGLPCIIT